MIKGLRPQIAEGGKIKIGRKASQSRTSTRGNTWRPPQKLNHFLVTTTQRDQAGDLMINRAVMDALPKDHDGKVRQIPVVVHSDDIDQIFPTSYAMYASRKIGCRGDGETAMRWPMDDQGRRLDGEPRKVECTCPYLGAGKGPKCKPNGILRCSIALPGQAVAGSVHTWRTTSIISIERMIGSIAQILEACGTIRGLPLTLKVEPVEVSPQGRSTTVYCCHLELRAENLIEAQQKALHLAQMRQAITTGDTRLMLPAPAAETEPEQEQADVADEFYYDAEPMAPTDEGKHRIPDDPPPQEQPEGDLPPLWHQIQELGDQIVSDDMERWLQQIIDRHQDDRVVNAACGKMELLKANRAKAAADREPPHDPATGEVAGPDMPEWDDGDDGPLGPPSANGTPG